MVKYYKHFLVSYKPDKVAWFYLLCISSTQHYTGVHKKWVENALKSNKKLSIEKEEAKLA
jgi:hypothetical protein